MQQISNVVKFLMLITFALLVSVQVSAAQEAKILAIGDSLMAWHSGSGRSISDSVGRVLQEPVENRSVSGAKIIHRLPISGAFGLKISEQLQGGDRDWVILTGGGNDLVLGCGCRLCSGRLSKMISINGRTGEIPNLVRRIRQTGARVVYVGYLRSPGVTSIIDRCRGVGDDLEVRLDRLAKLDEGIYFLSLAEMVPYGDRSMHVADMVHPSVKASRLIGARVATLIQSVDVSR
jgi:lysophospholipase L1-like esterase